MHIMEGFLPPAHAAAWTAASAPFVIYGGYRLTQVLRQHPETKLLLGAADTQAGDHEERFSHGTAPRTRG